MASITFREVEGSSLKYWLLFGGLGLFVLFGALSWNYMHHYGHVVTGMDNQIVWGLPHVFAVFLIVAASGALNVASIASVFNKPMYKPLAPLSAILAIALMLGGLLVLVLDLGRSDRLIVAMTHFNFKSMFTWNVFLYSGFFALVGIYLWTMLDRTVKSYSKAAGTAAFIWRLVLTTGTGSLFGFLVARELYGTAMLAPMFIIMSFAYGLAVYLMVLAAAYSWTGRVLGDTVMQRLRYLLAVFVAAVLYFVVTYHMTNLYFTKFHAVEAFILRDGGIFTTLFWFGQILVGCVIPLVILLTSLGKQRSWIMIACALVILGGILQMYVTIIGAQAYPLDLFPGMTVKSSFFDGVVNSYAPSVPELFLGLGGVAIALLVTTFAVKVLRLLPESLDDATVAKLEH
ncbi:MAG: molybdopterin oxidoreductase [Hydrogenophilales bacterium 16-64-46]|nr:MAG: molybdopterin oxidoreductase [Hydrogenophilales bacterium 12-64-13]OYZ05797.1 MAG: molybdopterin oxidoreductase [Hydrogenophilales bacterium 16-64-46]OZA39732.1 MAG: molybdopterin oxidoreductase [Hydrogenophilales bacterium 17-64-34]HQS98731.1 polysulfide reductase NrfD [Thiobacillus sp.]